MFLFWHFIYDDIIIRCVSFVFFCFLFLCVALVYLHVETCLNTWKISVLLIRLIPWVWKSITILNEFFDSLEIMYEFL